MSEPELTLGLTLKRIWRPEFVVILPTTLELVTLIIQRQKRIRIQALSSQAAVKRINKGITVGFPGRKKSSVHLSHKPIGPAPTK